MIQLQNDLTGTASAPVVQSITGVSGAAFYFVNKLDGTSAGATVARTVEMAGRASMTGSSVTVLDFPIGTTARYLDIRLVVYNGTNRLWTGQYARYVNGTTLATPPAFPDIADDSNPFAGGTVAPTVSITGVAGTPNVCRIAVNAPSGFTASAVVSAVMF